MIQFGQKRADASPRSHLTTNFYERHTMARQWVKALAEQKRAQREAAIRAQQEKDRAAELERSIFERDLDDLWKEVAATAAAIASEYNAIFGSEEVLVRTDDSGVVTIDRKETPRRLVRLSLKAPSRQIGVQNETAGVATHPGDVELLVADGHLRVRSQEFRNGAKLSGADFAEDMMRRYLTGL
jgi:hypothetical protein